MNPQNLTPPARLPYKGMGVKPASLLAGERFGERFFMSLQIASKITESFKYSRDAGALQRTLLNLKLLTPLLGGAGVA
ncbi:hypothetical protein AFK68_09680 [Hydrocoleum sp. CS-953]|nr:hypothetical protein AFK68_09680 [Hydrocoleum sp. CS-953]